MFEANNVVKDGSPSRRTRIELSTHGRPVPVFVGVAVRDEDDVPVREDDGVPVCDDDGVPVRDDEGVVVCDDDGVPVRDDDGVVVWEDEGVSVRDDDGVSVCEDEGVLVCEDDGVPVLDDDGEPVFDDEGVPVRDDDGVSVRDDEGVSVFEDDGVSVCDDEGVPVREDDGVPVCDDDGVPVRDEEGVVVCDDDGVPVCEDEGVFVRDDDGVVVCDDDGVPVSEDVGVTDGVTVGVTSARGGSATPRKTCPAGAVASAVSTCCALFHRYNVVRVAAYTANDRIAPAGVEMNSFRPQIEYTGSVAEIVTLFAGVHFPPTSESFCIAPTLYEVGVPCTASQMACAFSKTNVHIVYDVGKDGKAVVLHNRGVEGKQGAGCCDAETMIAVKRQRRCRDDTPRVRNTSTPGRAQHSQTNLDADVGSVEPILKTFVNPASPEVA